MFKKEEKLVIYLSAFFGGVLLFIFKGYIANFSYLYFLTIPTYLVVISCCNNLCDSRERVEDAVSYCLDESDFNVIDKIEKLRLYFKDTRDVIDYLSVVDSKVLAFTFDDRNRSLRYKEFVIGAVRCLSYIKAYKGVCYFNINSMVLTEAERIQSLLSTLYMVSKQIEDGCDSINITSKLSHGRVVVDVVDKYHNSMENDIFCEKLLTMFQGDHLALSSNVS